MRSIFLLILAVAPLSASAMEVPKFKSGGFLIHLQVLGTAPEHFDGQNINSQVGFGVIPVGDYFQQSFQSAPYAVGLRLAYNILGFVSVGADVTATGWSIFDDRRGGAGFAVGLIALHPLQFFFIQKEERPFGLDFSTHVGLGYGIIGVSQPQALAMDGIVVQWGLTVDYFFTKNFGLEFFAKCNFLKLDKFYTDWDSAHRGGGGAATINPTGNGTWWHTGIALVLRIGD